MVENQSLRGVGAAEPILWKSKTLDGYSGANLGENQALEGCVQRSQHGGKSKP